MIENTYSLYKLIVLYMLKKVSFPLTNAQISELMLSQNYTTYFRLQEVLTEMLDTDLIRKETKNHTTYYYLTDQGRQTLDYFQDEISPEIRREVSNYLVLHSYELRSDSSTIADYYLTSDHNYCVNCIVKEGGRTLIELKFTVPTEQSAMTLADNWKKKSQEAYAAVMQILM